MKGQFTGIGNEINNFVMLLQGESMASNQIIKKLKPQTATAHQSRSNFSSYISRKGSEAPSILPQQSNLSHVSGTHSQRTLLYEEVELLRAQISSFE